MDTIGIVAIWIGAIVIMAAPWRLDIEGMEGYMRDAQIAAGLMAIGAALASW